MVALGMVAVALWASFHLATWLVVDEEVRRADIAVVLGGGDGSRLSKGIELYDKGLADALVPVCVPAAKPVPSRSPYWPNPPVHGQTRSWYMRIA